LSPRIALNYKVNENLSIYGAVSHGFSPPTLAETLTPDGRINPDIKPEQGWNYESGLRGNLFRKSLSLDISLYTMQIKDLLVAKRIGPDAFVGVNAGKTAHTGLETTARFTPDNLRAWNSSITPSIFISYLYTHYRFVDFSEKGQDFSGNRLTGVPKDMLSAGIDMNTFIGIYGNLTFQHTGSMPMRDDNSKFSSPYSLLNGKLGYRRTLFNKINLNLYAGINNIFNEKYASMILVNAPSFGNSAPRYYYPGLPRNYYVNVKVGYLIR
jgi:iron complex outermembrane receptor protein